MFYIIYYRKVVAEQELQCYSLRNDWDGRTGSWRNQSSWPAAAKRRNWQQSNADDRAVDITIDSTTNTFDRHEEFVASDAISWRQGKFSWFAKGPSWLQCEHSANHFMEDSRKLKTTWIRIFENPDCSLKIWNLQIRRTHCQRCFCKDEACAYVCSAEDGNGYQAWQALLRARTARNATNLKNQLLEPTSTSPDPRINLRQWNKNAVEYATRTGERVSDGIRRAVYMNKIAPQDMRQHLMLNQSRLSTAEEVAQEIEDFGKGSGRKGKRKNAQRTPDFNPSVVNSESVVDTAIGVGESGTKKPSVGLNKSTQRTIHRKETFVDGRTQRTEGKVTASPRAKAKARENIQEKGTISRTRLDLRMKMDSARWVILVKKKSKSRICRVMSSDHDDFETPRLRSSSLCVLRSKVQ